MLVLAVIVLVLLCVAIFGVQQVPQFAPFSGLIILLLCVVAIAFIAQRAGLL